MHIEYLRLQRFRSCADVTVKLRPHLTALVGENNGGKSNIVDALRLLILPLNGRRDRYPEDDDLRKGSTEEDFAIEGHFADLSDTLKGLLIGAVPDPTVNRATLGMRYQGKAPGNLRGRSSFCAGKFDAAKPEPGLTDLIRHVYLPPLRDAKQTLGSGSAARIATLLQYFLEEGEETRFLDYVKRSGEPHRVIAAVNTQIDSALGSLTRGGVHRPHRLDSQPRRCRTWRGICGFGLQMPEWRQKTFALPVSATRTSYIWRR